MRKILLLSCALLAFNHTFAQDDRQSQDSQYTENTYADEEEPEDADAFFIDHKVTLGEKIIMISKKYMVDPKDIYKYNEEAINGVDEGVVLKIPLHKSHKKDLEGFKQQLEKKNGGPIQVAAPPKKARKPIQQQEPQEQPQTY
jgi:LysM repeat protein